MRRKGFTLIELVVALAILAVVIAMAGEIFRVSVQSHLTAVAHAEILQKLRVITGQLDTDFKGFLDTYPALLGVRVDRYSIGGQTVDVASDCITFFAAGDFQSTKVYSGKPVAGNVALLYYGQPDPNSFAGVQQPRQRLLLRRQTIAATSAAPAAGDSPRGEYYRKSPVEWRVAPPFLTRSDWLQRPVIDPNNVDSFVTMYLAKGVDNFMVEYAERDPATRGLKWNHTVDDKAENISTVAFKFTFTLYDSKGVFPKGKTFTHIIFLGA